MPQLYDISDWNQQPWYSTGGTRDKKYVQSPDGKYYYFKKSFKKEGREYFYEFWSEIVASEVGRILGFNLLKYDLAIDNGEMGCISESMINSDAEELIEGLKYLQAKDNKFKPEIRDTHKLYSFQLIVEALDEFKLSEYIDKIIEIIIFDSIIGNGDRHQENWAFVSENSISNKGIDLMGKDVKSGEIFKRSKLMQWVAQVYYDFKSKELKPQAQHVVLSHIKRPRYIAPIYDSGSSLGRENSESEINKMLADETEILNYIRKGKSEIHWEQKKVTHFVLIESLLYTSYAEITRNIIKRVIVQYNSETIRQIIEQVDKLVPESMLIYRLPESRKRFMYKLIDLRLENLKKLIN